MNPSEILRIVDAIHRDKNIEKEIVFEGIEAALISAAKKHYGEESEIEIAIDREDGSISGTCNGEPIDAEETAGRIGAQTAKQVMIQKIREAERDALYSEYEEQLGYMISGVIQRYEGGAATVALSNTEAILPRSEQIPGETHHANERVRATVCEVRKQGSRVKIILSRTRTQLVQRLFEQEIPEIADGVIEIKAIAREPGYRSKVAVASSDQRVDCVGACVGVRGNRIKNIVDELAGERIDIVRWSDDVEELIPNALQPAEVEQVILCTMLGRAIVLVREDQLSLAIGRRGQNVRLGSKLSGWDIEIMTQEELAESIDRAVSGYSEIAGVEVELAEKLVEQGFLSYDDLSIIEPTDLMEMGSLTETQVDAIVSEAERRAEEAEAAAEDERRKRREEERVAAEEASKASAEAAASEAAASEAEPTEAETAESASDDSQTSEAEAGEAEESPLADTPTDDAAATAEQDQESAGEAAATANSESSNGAGDPTKPTAEDAGTRASTAETHSEGPESG